MSRAWCVFCEIPNGSFPKPDMVWIHHACLLQLENLNGLAELIREGKPPAELRDYWEQMTDFVRRAENMRKVVWATEHTDKGDRVKPGEAD